ncbi:GDSL esterase/lipase 6 isoform X2 [Salvia hispanica]|uniref:GDSL esterase/lipase 6 isoform X2 n=1 Tax=Salvia hispanica TaxID=49212 RepID=UPI0020093A2C|nr:GDSL esterase/lipase 6 isoform X2 [Salvia hispanica]
METRLLLVSVILFLLAASAIGSKIPAIFIFGDSLLDAGNNPYIPNCTVQADFPPYGSSFFGRPTGRFTNGRTVADFISEYLGIPLQKPYMEVMNGTEKKFPANGINFASAGSGVLPSTNTISGVTAIQVQLQQFKSLVQKNQIDRKVVKDSLFLIESGSNDIFSYFDPSTSTPEAYIQTMLGQIHNFVDNIVSLGARCVALFGLGPVGCAPARSNLPGAPLGKCYDKLNKMVMKYNMGLQNLVNVLPRTHPGTIAVFGRVYETIQTYRAHPTRYGFVDVENACCGSGKLGGQVQCGKVGYKLCKNPNEYLFWDYFHPSERTCELISKALWAGGPTSIMPFNLKRLANMPVA